MTKTKTDAVKNLNITIRKAVRNFKPAESMLLDEWADRKRIISSDSGAAEPGQWRTDRTPYLREPMQKFTDPRVRKVVMVAASQVGKTEMELNSIGYIIDQDPSNILLIQPTLEDAKKYSRIRIAPMIRDCRCLKAKVHDVRMKDSGNTILQKAYPGGILTITGSNSASALASTPVRYVIGDERDRWALSAGTEGDPWKLGEARQRTFYNAKSIEVSTPTIKGASNIENAFYEGTQKRWCHKCPECGEYSEIVFDNIKFEFSESEIHGKKTYKLKNNPEWICPKCGCLIPEKVMRKAPAKWMADNPDPECSVESYWLNAFSSPWMPWGRIVLEFLKSKDDPLKLQVVYNTLFGKLWENRDKAIDEDVILSRREDYGTTDDKIPIELPKGVLVLTCAVDTQDNRLEYEVLGHGMYGETYGIRYGKLMGRPDSTEPDNVWERLDQIIDHVYSYGNGRGLRISITFVDSGGHFTQEVYQRCNERLNKRVFAIKGKGGEGIPFTALPSKVDIVKNNNVIGQCWLYTIGVDSGKEKIMANIKVQEPGPKYCHFPTLEDCGYDQSYFNGLLSEAMQPAKNRRGEVKWEWTKLPGHERNEPLDIRNYNLAAFRALNPNMDVMYQRFNHPDQEEKPKPEAVQKRKAVHDEFFDEW